MVESKKYLKQIQAIGVISDVILKLLVPDILIAEKMNMTTSG